MHKKLGGDAARIVDTNESKQVLHTKRHQAQYVKCGECARRGGSLFEDGLGIDRQAMSQ